MAAWDTGDREEAITRSRHIASNARCVPTVLGADVPDGQP